MDAARASLWACNLKASRFRGAFRFGLRQFVRGARRVSVFVRHPSAGHHRVVNSTFNRIVYACLRLRVYLLRQLLSRNLCRFSIPSDLGLVSHKDHPPIPSVAYMGHGHVL